MPQGCSVLMSTGAEDVSGGVGEAEAGPQRRRGAERPQRHQLHPLRRLTGRRGITTCVAGVQLALQSWGQRCAVDLKSRRLLTPCPWIGKGDTGNSRVACKMHVIMCPGGAAVGCAGTKFTGIVSCANCSEV